MKKLIIGLFLLVGVLSWGQDDTIYVDNFIDFNQEFLSKLTPSIYEGRLINRSSMEDITLLQLIGKDNQPHSWVNWMFLYSDIYHAYVDNTNRLSVEEIYTLLEKKSFEYRRHDARENIQPMAEDIVNIPFALILEDVYKLKDSIELFKYAEVQNNRLVPIGSEVNLYEKITLKSAAILDIYPPQGFKKGKLHYEQDLIIHSANITINNIKIDVGYGYTAFSENDKTISYTIDTDTTFAKVAISYTKDRIKFNDTLDFILVNNLDKRIQKNLTNNFSLKNGGASNFNLLFFYPYPYDNEEDNPLEFDVGVIIGCGNESEVEGFPSPYDETPILSEAFFKRIKDIKRPIIILPPYKPSLQKTSMDFYYNKYNIDGFIDEIVAKGYDVLIIREEPGNSRISTAGKLLANFITHVNDIKKYNFPDEDWENIVMGFSAGGQHARYALNTLEKDHMRWGTPHHHTRLYIPFDSPHNGANVPVSIQAVFWEYARTLNPIAIGVLAALYDDASKDMLAHHISSNFIFPIGPGMQHITLTKSSRRTELMNELKYEFNHDYSHTDQRNSFPSFSRNIAVSMGRFDKGYSAEFGLESHELLFRQLIPVTHVTGYGFRSANNVLYAAPINPSSSELIFRRMETRGNIFAPIQTIILRRYETGLSSPGYDQARGGYKNVFYDGQDDPWVSQFIGAVQIMRLSNFGLGVKHYKNNISFMPLTSAFAIKNGNKANILQNFNPQNEGLMYQKYESVVSDISSNHFGYPHLGRPNDHFNITPFEAIYVDDFTYEHIDVTNTITPDKLNYLDSLRVFLRDEIEGDNFYLQNKIIGQNHANWLSELSEDYKYKAWYKANKELHIGYDVTPKTNKGDYIIEETGEITVYAGEKIVLKPGFHAQVGSKFHAFIQSPPCKVSGMSQSSGNKDESDKTNEYLQNSLNESETPDNREENTVKIYPNPNNGSFTIVVTAAFLGGEFILMDTYGRMLYQEKIKQSTTRVNQHFKSGIYFITVFKGDKRHTEKIIVQ